MSSRGTQTLAKGKERKDRESADAFYFLGVLLLLLLYLSCTTPACGATANHASHLCCHWQLQRSKRDRVLSTAWLQDAGDGCSCSTERG